MLWWEGVSFSSSDGQGCVRWYVVGCLWGACLPMTEFVVLSCVVFG